MTYNELSKLPAEAFLDWRRFATDNDHLAPANYADEQYRKGLEIGEKASTIYISVTSVWSATLKSGGSIFSYEGIGYHSCTDQLLRGFLDSGCRIVVARRTPTELVSVQITPAVEVAA